MERSKQAKKSGEKKGSRWLVGAIVSLIVLGGAVSAGSALGKKDNPAAAVDTFMPVERNFHIETHFYAKEAGGQQSSYAFEIKDFSFGVENPTTIGSATGGAGAGKIKFNEFQIKKTVDKASPAFFKNCASGAHYATVTLEMRKVNDKNASDSTTFQRFTFDTVFTTKIDWSGPGDEGPEESITFVYGKLGIEYIGNDPSTATSAGWDQIQNKAWDPRQGDS